VGDLVPGDDGLPVEDGVGEWVEEKHRILTTYLSLHAKPRLGFLGKRRGGATYIDVFCGPGRARIRDTTKYIDGSAVVAWKASVEQGAPFTTLYIADKDVTRRAACAERLQRLGAPVVEVTGEALEAAYDIVSRIDQRGLDGLHFAFVDPYSLGALNLDLLQALASVKRMDVLVHLSAMDLFRNLDRNLSGELHEFDAFAPGWRDKIPSGLSKDECRRAIINHWKSLIDEMGMEASADLKPVRNSNNRDLYWLLLIARHDLAQKFWRIALRSDTPQRGFDY
jgi:three-Cys-motif partner protein